MSLVHDRSLKFADMRDFVVLDEKWFYLCETTSTFYLGKDAPLPHLTGKSSRFLPKVMFLCAVARPRFDSNGVCTFDGKIGMWPFVKSVPALRSSRNRPAGTPALTNMNVTREVYTSYLLEKVYPAIGEKFPRRTPEIFVQQDNAPVHPKEDDDEVAACGKQGRCNYTIVSQPPNSPDFNVLDLGFFRAIQSLQYKAAPRNMEELINFTMAAYDAYNPRNLDDAFITQQKCLELAMLDSGGNKYKLPHLGKQMRRNQGNPITEVVCDPAAYNLARNLVNEPR